MCCECWDETTAAITPDTDRVVELIRELYAQPRCDTGGPLHVELDDWNLDYEVITPTYSSRNLPDDWSRRVHEICDEIGALMTPMTEAQRETCVAMAQECPK